VHVHRGFHVKFKGFFCYLWKFLTYDPCFLHLGPVVDGFFLLKKMATVFLEKRRRFFSKKGDGFFLLKKMATVFFIEKNGDGFFYWKKWRRVFL